MTKVNNWRNDVDGEPNYDEIKEYEMIVLTRTGSHKGKALIDDDGMPELGKSYVVYWEDGEVGYVGEEDLQMIGYKLAQMI